MQNFLHAPSFYENTGLTDYTLLGFLSKLIGANSSGSLSDESPFLSFLN